MTSPNIQQESQQTVTGSSKSGFAALIMCVFFGVFGLHRFYVGKIWTGLLMLFTFGCFGIWSLVDAISIISNTFEDKQGRVLTCISKPSSLKKALSIILAAITQSIIIVFFIIMFAIYLTNDLVTIIEKQLIAARANNFQESYSYTAKDFQRSTSLDTFKQFLNQYPPLSHNASMSFSKREMNNNRGVVVGTLKAEDGTVIRIQYLLIKENNQWKILGILINPKEAEQDAQANAFFETNVEISKSDKAASTPPETTSSDLFVYKDPKAKFSAICMKSWDYGSKKVGSFFCTGKKGTDSYQTFINVHMIDAKKRDGKYLTIKEYIDSVKNQIIKIDPQAKFLDQGAAELPQNPQQFKGEYFISTFSYKNQVFKRLEFIVSKDDHSAIYDWSYTSTVAQYDKDLPYAKKVYEGLTIQ